MSKEKQFHRALMEAVAECRRIGYNPNYFVQMLDEHGPLETARHLINAPQASDGFTTLWERNRLDLSVEAIVLRPEFTELFSTGELDAATHRLEDYGYSR